MAMERREFLTLTAGALTYALAAESTWAQTHRHHARPRLGGAREGTG
ncbi:MAG TPA: hypothetical protein VE997_04185 [Candidatus Limnocylindria bacterium]|jgi:hypothetical protein|nr:hypothetical protein [Candidatus Limnocylindria bacterium]